MTDHGEGEGKESPTRDGFEKRDRVYRRPNRMKEAFLFCGRDDTSSSFIGEDLFPNRMNEAFLFSRGISVFSCSLNSCTRRMATSLVHREYCSTVILSDGKLHVSMIFCRRSEEIC